MSDMFNVPNPIDPNSPQAVGVTPAPDMDSAQPPMRPASDVPRQGPQMPLPQAQPPEAPTPQPRPAAPVAPPATPAEQHAGIFKNVLGMISGGMNRPVMGPNGQPQTDANGQVIMKPAGAKQLGAGILAGAIASMVAGMSAPTQYQTFGEGIAQRKVADYGASVGAGAAAAQPFTQEGAQKKAQGQADENQVRRLATTDHNLKMHAALMNNMKLQGEVMTQGVQEDAPLVEAMKAAQIATGPDGKPVLGPDGKPMQVIQGQGVTEAQLQKMMADGSAHVTRESVLRDGVAGVYDENGQPVLNEDGSPKQQYTYTVYNHDAMVQLTQDMKADRPELGYVAPGTPIPMAVLAKGNVEKMNMQNAQGFVNEWAKDMADFTGKDNKPIDLKAAIAKDPYLRKIVPQLGRYAGMEPDQVIAQMDKDGVDPALIGKFSQLLGGVDRVKMAAARADDVLKQKNKETEDKIAVEAAAKRLTPEGQADLKHKQLENLQLQQALAQASAQGKGIEVPKNFQANPKANQMSEAELTSDLHQKGVQMPSNFPALYAIAHNAADLATLPTTPRKGVPVMPRDQALSFIRTYINPQYNEGDFSAAKKLDAEMASTRVGTAGGTLLSLGVASQHLSMMLDASSAMKNNDVQKMNAIKQRLGIELGAAAPVVFAAIAQKVNTEVEKVVSGSAPMEAQLKEGKENLNRLESPEQVDGVVRAYVGLMNGRLGEIDDRSMQYYGRHVKGVSPETITVFNKLGFTTPGQPAGAKGQFMANGVAYWTDGKTNLGPVEKK